MNKKKTLEIFNDFVESYDITNSMINLKYSHTKRVAEYCEKISTLLKLKQDDIDLAWHIGIFHDLSRFEQATIYKTFDDSKSFDHALHAVQLLFDDGFIKQFNIDEKFFPIIYKSIRYHNQYKIPDNLTEYEKLFCRIIRDADMLDIIMIYKNLGWYNDDLKKQEITEDVLSDFLSGKSIKHEKKNTDLDRLVGTLGFINEIYFDESKKILIKSGVLDEITNINALIPKTKLQLEKIKIYINEYKYSQKRP